MQTHATDNFFVIGFVFTKTTPTLRGKIAADAGVRQQIEEIKMANWESKTVSEVITKISDSQYVLPVIQRRLVWSEEKMELLFDTLMKGNSFGGIMVLEEEKGSNPLFAYREFTKDGSDIKSSDINSPLSQEQYFVIDGQQRLQSFYIGLTGSFIGKLLYFNLNSDGKQLEYDFKFTDKPVKLPGNQKNGGDEVIENIWYPANQLYNRARKIQDPQQLQSEIVSSLNLNGNIKSNSEANILKFYLSIFTNQSIGISKVIINKSLPDIDNKQRIVELFRRLNDGGTKLSSFELVASILKGFSWEMESFLDEMIKSYSEIGIGQDELIKLIFILQDNHRKEMVNVSAEDAKFAIAKKGRIKATLEALSNFLHSAKLYNYYKEGNRSAIPLYFIAYYIFHQEIEEDKLSDIFDRFDIKSNAFNKIYRWVYISLLNGVFKSKGAGWIPYKTGIRKILEEIKGFKNKDFPEQEIYNLYRQHPLHFFEESINKDQLGRLDNSIVYYILYDCGRIVRQQDIDHIHPKSILESKNVPWDKIHSISNFQLLDSRTNRGEKNGKELKEWISNKEYVEDKDSYLSRHSIPINPELWDSDNFDEFIKEREQLIIGKIKNCLTRCSS